MTKTWLPPHAWPLALLGTELETVWPHLPSEAKVWAVVSEGGEVVACGAFFPMLHHEGFWIHDAHRRSKDVWAEVGQVLAAHQPFLTASDSPVIARLLEKSGALKLPGTFWRCGENIDARTKELGPCQPE